MAVLSTTDRQRVWRGLMRLLGGRAEPVNFAKDDLLAAISATDDWIDANAAAFNTALPLAFRTSATAVQKTILFCAVALARVSIAFVRSVFGEVD